jgi:hypothetical protein
VAVPSIAAIASMTNMMSNADLVGSLGAQFSSGSTEAKVGEPFLYSVASRLHRLLHLPRDHQLAIWRRVLDLYAQTNRSLPKFLKDLCHESHVDAILANEVFWRMTEMGVNRKSYARATDYLPALFATAALLAAQQDMLPLPQEDLSLLGGPS